MADPHPLQGFRAELDDLIERWMPLIGPNESDGDDRDPIAEAEMGQPYPAAWVLLIGVQGIEPESPAFVRRISPISQSPWTGIGLLYDALDAWMG